MKNVVLSLIGTLLLASCNTEMTIVDRAINFDDERIGLTLEYLSDHYGIIQDVPVIEPKMIVVHWTAIPSLEKSFNAFKDNKLPDWRPDIQSASALNVSSQFLIDQDGTIYRLMPENYMARHVIGLNHCAIGIENVGGGEKMPLTKSQLKSNIWLINYLNGKYDIQYVLGHYEYTLFEGHELWKEIDDGYRTTKTDPGKEFLADIRAAIVDLNLKSIPKKVISQDSISQSN